jgi:hypothetical protein
MGWTSPGRSRARRTVEVGVAALIIGAVTSLAAPTAASAVERWKAVRVAPAPSSPSVMIQLSTLGQAVSPAGLRSWMRSICPTGVVATGSLALQDVATDNGTLLTDYLDVLAPYLPGVATHPCFSRVYVGTVEPVYTGAGNAYGDGVQDTAFLGSYLSRSNAVATKFIQSYPRVTTDWYITYEANLNELYYPQVAAAYTTLLTAELKSRAALRPNRHVMWSPAFWYPYSSYSTNTLGMTGLRTSLTAMFTALKTVGRGVDVVNLQDYVAGSSCQPGYNRVTASDAVGWTSFLRSLGVIPEVAVNAEQYAVNCATGGIVNGSPTEVRNREAYYRANNVALGPAFELRYWMHNHF